ncbi:PREDICTED: protein max-like [Acropora digitifera]|uniref:protein max-like n=1 Tax=Acropora digitifera TaxID=70779 RepID=UPI00077A3B52|nr:PREDICTED: protein max-like [Acropora digitifera]
MTKSKVYNMSDEEKEIDIESEEEGTENGEETQFMSQADKRAHHNALERKRRDHIKDSFAHLRDSIPSLQGEKVRFKEVDLFTMWRKIRCNQPKCKT